MDNIANIGLYSANLGPAPAKRTFVVIGVGRGGTSMVAGVLSSVGIDMGRLSGVTFEDLDIRDVTKNFPSTEWMENLMPIFERKNKKLDIWGFKVPKFSKHLMELSSVLRNPVFIFVFRDPVAIAVRNVVSTSIEFSYSMKHTLMNYKLFAEFIETTKQPLVAISYEKAIIEPELMVRTLVELLAIDASEEMVLKAINFIEPSPEEYTRVPKKT